MTSHPETIKLVQLDYSPVFLGFVGFYEKVYFSVWVHIIQLSAQGDEPKRKRQFDKILQGFCKHM